MQNEFEKIIRKISVGIQRWLLTDKWGRVLMLLSAKLTVTPNMFNQITGMPRSIYRRLGYAAVLGAAFGFAFCMSQTVLIVFQSKMPDIPGVTGAEYSTSLNQIAMGAFGVYWLLAAMFTLGIGVWVWGFHRFVSWAVGKVNIDMVPRPLSYFTLTTASCIVLFGVTCLVAVLFSHTVTTGDLAWLEQYLEKHPWQSLLLMVSICLVDQRRQQVRRESLHQLYPTALLRHTIPFLTFIIPLGVLWWAASLMVAM